MMDDVLAVREFESFAGEGGKREGKAQIVYELYSSEGVWA